MDIPPKVVERGDVLPPELRPSAPGDGPSVSKHPKTLSGKKNRGYSGQADPATTIGMGQQARNDRRTEIERIADRELAVAVGSESLPVLGAFKGFVDQERRRAKRAILTLFILFVSLMVVILCVGGFVASVFFHQLKSDITREKGLAAAASEEVAKVRMHLAEESRELRNLARGRQEDVARALTGVADLDSSLKRTAGNVERLEATLAALKAGEVLPEQTDELTAALAGLTNQVGVLFRENALLKKRVGEMAPLRTTTGTKPNANPIGIVDTPLQMGSTDSKNTVMWRLPDPSR